jgi:nitroreductase
LSDARLEKERGRYAFAPLVIVVVASIDTQSSVPPVEQVLSAGCVAHNLLLGTYALGYGAQWLTGWAAYDPQVAALLGLGSHEQVIGFVHIGTPRIEVPDRERPALADVLVHWQP